MSSGELKLRLCEKIGADLICEDGDLVTENNIQTAVLISLFTDARAPKDADLPDVLNPDRRGWWGSDISPPVPDYNMGSLLWLLERSKVTNEVLSKAKDYTQKALQWMIDDKVVDEIEINVQRRKGDILAIQAILYRPDEPDVNLRYDLNWEVQDTIESPVLPQESCVSTCVLSPRYSWQWVTIYDSDGFEAPTYVVGNIVGQDSWQTFGGGTTVVTNLDSYEGAQCLRITRLLGAGRPTIPDAIDSPIDVEFYLKSHISVNDANMNILATGFTSKHPMEIHSNKLVWDTVTLEQTAIAADTWYKIKFFIHTGQDYVDIYVDDDLKFSNLAMDQPGNFGGMAFGATGLPTIAVGDWYEVDNLTIKEGRLV